MEEHDAKMFNKPSLIACKCILFISTIFTIWFMSMGLRAIELAGTRRVLLFLRYSGFENSYYLSNICLMLAIVTNETSLIIPCHYLKFCLS